MLQWFSWIDMLISPFTQLEFSKRIIKNHILVMIWQLIITLFNLQATANYKISDNWTSKTIVSRSNTKSKGYYQYLWDQSNGKDFQRYIANINGETNTTGIQQNINGSFNIGNLKNKLLIGLDYFQQNFIQGGTNYAEYGMVDIVSQSDTMAGYLSQSGVDSVLKDAKQLPSSAESKIYSAYVSDVINILPNLSAMLSLRADHFTGRVLYATTDSKAKQHFLLNLD